MRALRSESVRQEGIAGRVGLMAVLALVLSVGGAVAQGTASQPDLEDQPRPAAPPPAPPQAGQPPAEAPTPPQATPTPSAGGAVIEQSFKAEELVLSGKGGYNYDPAGRRDPFVDPLSAKGPGGPDETPRPEGWPGMLISEVKLQGITVYDGEPIALFLGTDGVGYFAREGDELWDGKIITIDFEEGKVVFQQKVEDPSSPIRFRDVVKKLNP